MKKRLFVVAFIAFMLLLSACGTENITFTISFDSNGGSDIESIAYDGQTQVSIPDNPTKEGFIFDGWFWDNGTFLIPFTANSLLDQPIQSDLTVYAKWITPDSELTIQLKQIYALAVEALAFEGTYEEWLETVRGPKGLPGERGKEVVFQVSNGYIQWRYFGDPTWNNLISLTELIGPKGDHGKTVMLQVADGFIQWRYDNQEAWTNLISLASLTGSSGLDGREVLFQVNDTHIQWKYDGEADWNNLISLDLLKGKDGIDAKEILFQVAEGFIQWQYEGDVSWTNLVSLAVLTGASGLNGRNVLFQTNEGYIQWQYEGDVTWQNLMSLDLLKGAQGIDGKEVLFQVAEGYIQWKYEGDDTWINLISLALLTGTDGVDAKNVVFQTHEGYIQWKYEDGLVWHNLLSLDLLKGKDGIDGVDGKEVVFQVADGYIQWQYVGDDIWTNLIEVNQLIGETGQDGLSAYEIYLSFYPEYQGDEEQFINDLINGKLGVKDTHDITFELDGGVMVFPQVYAVETMAAIDLPTPVKAGHTFLGWFTGFGIHDIQFSSYTPVVRDVTLYAKWQINSYTISFVSNGGPFIDDQTYTYGFTINELPVLTKEGHTFLGWYKDVEGQHHADIPFTVDQHYMLYAMWNVNAYAISYKALDGSVIELYRAIYGTAVTQPEDPIDDYYIFVGWYKDAEFKTNYTFDTIIAEDVEIYARWEAPLWVDFVTSLDMDPLRVEVELISKTVDAPDAPVKEGYRFVGWFNGKAGLTWLETEAVSFPLEVTASKTLYAYFEPIHSKLVQYTDAETYGWSLQPTEAINLNPMGYKYAHELQLLNMMATPLYATEIDWGKAIQDGIANFPGDFSKIEDKQYSIELLQTHYVKIGATAFPKDSTGNEHLTVDHKFDIMLANNVWDNTWTISIRDDLVFEDGTPITAQTYLYALMQYLSPTQNNYRAQLFYKNDVNPSGYPILNAYEYYSGVLTDFNEVGFTVIDDYTFRIFFHQEISQANVISLANRLMLVHPSAYEGSLDAMRTNSNYGTINNPFISYGAYVIQSWNASTAMVLNKNYDYVAKGNINYKSQKVYFVSSVDERMTLFANGHLSETALNNDYYSMYENSSNLYKSWDNYPQYLTLNLANSKYTEGGYQQPSIMFNEKFRQALMYGFDRKTYASLVYAPNTPSLMPIPSNVKAYLNDPLYYVESQAHLDVLASLGIDPLTEGYIPDRAVTLFNEAYQVWLNEGNTGPVYIRLIVDGGILQNVLNVNYVKQQYETLFGSDKIIIEILTMDSTSLRSEISNWNFDMALVSIGFGTHYGLWWQYPAIAFIGSMIGGGNLGLSQPYDKTSGEIEGYAAYYYEMIEVDLTATYQYLLSLGEAYMIDNNKPGHIELLNLLKPVIDELTGETIKPAGIYRGSVGQLAILFLTNDTPYDGADNEPFEGATEDTWAIAAAFEKVFYKYVPHVPTVTRTSAVVYADNVVIWWPAYSTRVGWGDQRYRYLSSDMQFTDGYYNPYQSFSVK